MSALPPIPTLRPITARVLQRPAYRNERIASFPAWLEDNATRLTKWWCDCADALRAAGERPASPDEFDEFCRCQWDLTQEALRSC